MGRIRDRVREDQAMTAAAATRVGIGSLGFNVSSPLEQGDLDFLGQVRGAISEAGTSGNINLTGDQIERLRSLAGDDPEATGIISSIEERTAGAVAKREARAEADKRTLELARRRGRASTILTRPQSTPMTARSQLGTGK